MTGLSTIAAYRAAFIVGEAHAECGSPLNYDAMAGASAFMVKPITHEGRMQVYEAYEAGLQMGHDGDEPLTDAQIAILFD